MGQVSSWTFSASVGLIDNSFVVVEHKVIDIALTVGIVLAVNWEGLYKNVPGTNLELPLPYGNNLLYKLQPSLFILWQHFIPLPFFVNPKWFFLLH